MRKFERRKAVEYALDFDANDFFRFAIADKLAGTKAAKQKIASERRRHGKALMSSERQKEIAKPVSQTIRFTKTGGVVMVDASSFTATGKIRKALMASYKEFRVAASTTGGEYVLSYK